VGPLVGAGLIDGAVVRAGAVARTVVGVRVVVGASARATVGVGVVEFVAGAGVVLCMHWTVMTDKSTRVQHHWMKRMIFSSSWAATLM
jgi:hypothetical protein